MNLLAVDTSTTSCSVALFGGDVLLAEAIYTAGRTHSHHLLSMIHSVLKRCTCKPMDIGGIAVTLGPGTFTGLRIGISTVKGLAAAVGASVVGVSGLAALALPFLHIDGPVVAMIDARRGEVYHACYRGGKDTLIPVAPAAVDAPQAAAAALPQDAILVGSGALLYREILESCGPRIRFANASGHVIRAASVGLLSMARFTRRDVHDLDSLVPDYIRKSDAQIQLPGTC
jgi:tRNA threonylcarbamoyladenosine biosynthesis protein TsaB